MSNSTRPLIVVAVALIAALAASHMPATAGPRPRDVMNAAELELALRKLQVLGSVLFVAAHPDDENTALLAYLVGERSLRTAYLSVTRGDGGQNLIGSETGEALGVIRTQELLAARRVDGAEQYFTRALDFGYSKSPDETMRIWGHDEILADVVWVIRTFRPDVIITRFPTNGDGGHGHHTASAVLAEEAFAAAADPSRFPEQLARVQPWQAKRVVWNAFRRDGSVAPSALTIDIGTYNPRLGRSYSEIAAASRSMHKSQGFGAAERRGSIPNLFEPRAGDSAKADLFEGIDLGWSRVGAPGARIDAQLVAAARDFRADRPHLALPALLRARALMRPLSSQPWVAFKLAELDEVIRSAAGLWLEAIAAQPSASPGAELKVTLSALNRSPAQVALERIELPHGGTAIASAPPPPPFGAAAVVAASPPDTVRREVRDRALELNRPVTAEARLRLSMDLATSEPYWLRRPPGPGRAEVDPLLIGVPENPAAVTARFVVAIGGERIPYDVPVAYRWTDPVAGERYRPFDVVPPVTVRFEQAVHVFPDLAPRELRVVAQSGEESVRGTVRLELPTGWRVEPATQAVELKGKGDERTVIFTVHPGASGGVAAAVVESEGREHRRRLARLDHPHIPVQTLLPPAEAKLVRADIKHVGDQVGYVMGSGDQVPEALRQLGYAVTLLSDEDVERANLGRYHAIVVGVRAYNTRPRLRALQSRLITYVENGGTLVVQYSTAETALEDKLGPFPFKISRDRVTDEGATVSIDAAHPLLARPNAIGPDDFKGWVQERGLYFANPYDPRYQTPLTASDPGEKASAGGLLYARHGRGVFVYTGYAWFRQLPAGVPGAYRLFANLVSAKP